MTRAASKPGALTSSTAGPGGSGIVWNEPSGSVPTRDSGLPDDRDDGVRDALAVARALHVPATWRLEARAAAPRRRCARSCASRRSGFVNASMSNGYETPKMRMYGGSGGPYS